ncbi:MAG: hypothetical protein LBM02_07175 [Lachnospiraceae bacterium]|jgi:folate-dependent tRNA-U54 methylase TrmFO/GidA|nr:hypothetical protein [Lachnospiraceae bacterium]
MIEKKTIKIPTQIKLKTEFFDGFGMAELIKTITVGSVFSIIAYCIYLITKSTLTSMFVVICSITISVVFLVKGRNNFSMQDAIANIIKFTLIQKEYKYVRGNYDKKEVSLRKNAVNRKNP